jgi:hypothetical protein
MTANQGPAPHGRPATPEAGGVPAAAADQALLREAAALHRAIFGTDVASDVAQHYAAAHRYCLQQVTDQEQRWMEAVVARHLDLVALEAAFRVLGRDHVLVRKAKILVYVAEAVPMSFHAFVNEERQRLFALLAMTGHVMRSAVNLVKGIYLLRRYRLQDPHA